MKGFLIITQCIFLSVASCDVNGVLYEKNISWTQEPSRDVDIVLVSSEGDGMKSVASLLPGIVQHLEKDLKDHQMNPQFGLVGFSGKAPVHRPGHSHTIKGQLWGDGKDFTKRVIDHMEFAKR